MSENTLVVGLNQGTDLLYIQLAREIAMDHFALNEVLERYNISHGAWAFIKNNRRFIGLLEQEKTAWQSAINTHERTRFKAAAIMELFLPEASKRLHDHKEALSGKVKLAELISKLAGMGERTPEQLGDGQRFSVTINLGADHQIAIDKTVKPVQHNSIGSMNSGIQNTIDVTASNQISRPIDRFDLRGDVDDQ